MGLLSIFTKEDKARQTNNMPKDEETGVAGDAVFGGYDNELARTDHISIKDYRKMRDTDATIDSLFNIVTLPILATTFGVRAAEDDIDEEQAEFIRTSLFKQPYLGGMEIPFSLILEQMLHAVIDGFEVFERVYKIDESGRITLKKLALRDATTVSIKVDETGGYNGIRQQATFGNRSVDVVIPAHKTFLFTYGKADSQYYGRSAFKSCWKNWDKKQKIEYLDSISIQNSAVKPKILKRIADSLVVGSDDRKKALRTLSELGRLKPVASIPYGFDVSELQGGDNSNINESIERQNSEMARSFLASFSLLGTQGSSSVGSYALSADQSDLFMLALKGTMNLITDHINQYWVADLIDLNFPVGDRHYPEFYFDSLTESNLELLKNAFIKLVEKDKISADVIAGVEKKIVDRFEIEPVETEPLPRTQSETAEEAVIAAVKNTKKEDFGGNADKFQQPEGLNDHPTDLDSKFHRELLPGEEKVNFDGILKQSEKVCAKFEEKALPLLENYIRKVAENPEQKIELPSDYVELIRKTYKTSYNYGKLSASDEEKIKAPKTTDDEKRHTEDFVNFVVKKQVSAIEDLVMEKKMQVASEGLLTSLILSGALALASQLVTGTSSTIFSQAMNAGRNDTYAAMENAEDEDATYMWSALLENSCATCEALDGSTYTKREADRLRYQPGFVHMHCQCIWVRMTGSTRPTPTGLPPDVDSINYLQVNPKAELTSLGVLKDGETKMNAIRRVEYNNTDDGKTLNEVSKAIRPQEYETLAVFDGRGRKIVDYTSNDIASVRVNSIEEFSKYLHDNEGVISVHNHPGGRSFSLTDILNAGDLKEIRVVSTYADYSLKVGENGWGDADAMKAFYEQEYNRFRDRAIILYNVGHFETTLEAERWLSDKVIESLAKEFGLKYNRKVW